MEKPSIQYSFNTRTVRGMTLIEMVVAIGVIVVAFVGFFNVFRASVDYVQSAKAREGAVSLATERMEQLRAMSYSALGTVEGIPSGTIAQNETVVQDNITYNRRTLIKYFDDPADGLGAADTNHDAADYKVAKVDVSWPGPHGTESVSETSNFIPEGIESTSGGGTLSLQAIDAQGNPVSNAAVHITNTTQNIDVTTYSDSTGYVLFPGTPQGSGYHIAVSKTGYSNAQTYPVSGSNPNPSPGDLTIATGQTTSQTFGIDLLAALIVKTWKPILAATTTDLLNDSSNIASVSNTAVSGGQLQLAPADGLGNYVTSGSAYTVSVAPSYLAGWTAFSWHASIPAQTSLLMHLYQVQGGSYALVPDAVLPGNSAGFSISPVNLSGVATSTYPSLVAGATLSTSYASSTPALLDWSLSYKQGPTPLPNIPFTLQGAKTIGSNSGGAPIYKTTRSLSTDSTGQYSTTTLEWDSYTTSVASATGYDISSYCPNEPLPVAPASSQTLNLFLSAHTTNSLIVAVASASGGAVIPNASVTVSRTGYSSTVKTDSCGDAFFSGLTAASDYAVQISATGYTTQNLSNINVSGQSQTNVSL